MGFNFRKKKIDDYLENFKLVNPDLLNLLDGYFVNKSTSFCYINHKESIRWVDTVSRHNQ